jgi:hypothetical protein
MAMGFRFICPSTGHKIEAAGQVDDEDLMLRTENITTQCSFCGGSHEWVFVAGTRANGRPKASHAIGCLPIREMRPNAE